MIKVKSAKSSCLNSFSSCKQAEDASIGLIHICNGGTTPAPPPQQQRQPQQQLLELQLQLVLQQQLPDQVGCKNLKRGFLKEKDRSLKMMFDSNFVIIFC